MVVSSLLEQARKSRTCAKWSSLLSLRAIGRKHSPGPSDAAEIVVAISRLFEPHRSSARNVRQHSAAYRPRRGRRPCPLAARGATVAHELADAGQSPACSSSRTTSEPAAAARTASRTGSGSRRRRRTCRPASPALSARAEHASQRGARARRARHAALRRRLGVAAAGRGPHHRRARRPLRRRRAARASWPSGLARRRARAATPSTCTCCASAAASRPLGLVIRTVRSRATCSRRTPTDHVQARRTEPSPPSSPGLLGDGLGAGLRRLGVEVARGEQLACTGRRRRARRAAGCRSGC